MLLRKVSAAKEHAATYNTQQAAFSVVAEEFNSNCDFRVVVESKTVRDRYERLQRTFHSADRKDAIATGVGGDVREADELLSQIREARDDLKLEKDKVTDEIKRRDERKLKAGALLVPNATTSTAIVVSDADDAEEDRETNDVNEGPSKRYRRSFNMASA